MGLNIRTVQRWAKAENLDDQRKGPHSPAPHRLSEKERADILAVVNAKEYADLPPSQIVPKLADNGIYIASESSFYRVLHAAKQLSYRRKQSKPKNKKPIPHIATSPNQVWSWDISYLPTIVQGIFYYLYFFIDIYSRKIVGFGVYERELASHAIKLMEQACFNENIERNQVVLHSDNGSPMKASTWIATLHNLGVTPSYSRPSVSNDNPYSESLFKTTKYSHLYPRTPFNSLDSAQLWVEQFVKWYNEQHMHSGINFVTPKNRHMGEDVNILRKRTEIYSQAQQRNPKRWTGDIRNWKCPEKVILNPGKRSTRRSGQAA